MKINYLIYLSIHLCEIYQERTFWKSSHRQFTVSSIPGNSIVICHCLP